MTLVLKNTRGTWVPFAYGFRPFFLLAGVYALVSIAMWLRVYLGGTSPLPPLPPQYWHGHEMIFGFISAAIAGFLLTAVPSWTGRTGVAGFRLMILTILWLVGRVAFFMGDVLPIPLFAAAELAFVPVLILMLAPALVGSGNRNWPMLLVLAALWMSDVMFIAGLYKGDALVSRNALLAALNLVLLLMTVIGGRIVPAFTRNALRAASKDVSLRSSKVVDHLVIVSMLTYGLFDVFSGDSTTTAVIAVLTAGLQLWRLLGWQGWRTMHQPIVWVLHLGYAWIPVGLALKAAWIVGGFGWAAYWQHAFGIGAASMMIVAVMTRAALGHTGRSLKVHGLITIAYGLLALAAVVRVFGTTLFPFHYSTVVLMAGVLWVSAFVPYLFIYAPILLRKRVDDKPG